MTSFEDRLQEYKEEFVLKGLEVQAAPDVWLTDQILSAAGDNKKIYDFIAENCDEFAGQESQYDFNPTFIRQQEVYARIRVPLDDCWPCEHLGTPQPVFALLTEHRLVCVPCLATIGAPPPGEDDRCDWCGDRGVEWFKAMLMTMGPLTVAGEACPSCADALEVK